MNSPSPVLVRPLLSPHDAHRVVPRLRIIRTFKSPAKFKFKLSRQIQTQIPPRKPHLVLHALQDHRLELLVELLRDLRRCKAAYRSYSIPPETISRINRYYRTLNMQIAGGLTSLRAVVKVEVLLEQPVALAVAGARLALKEITFFSCFIFFFARKLDEAVKVTTVSRKMLSKKFFYYLELPVLVSEVRLLELRDALLDLQVGAIP